MINGISHMTFIVKNLDRMELLLIGIFDAKKIYNSSNKIFSLSQERFFKIADLWIAIMEGESLPTQTYNHIAFKIDDADYESYITKVQSCGLALRESRPRVQGEGRSIYFYDHDKQLFELHTGTLQERLASYA